MQQGGRRMSRTVCFIDKDGGTGVCARECEGLTEIDCEKCDFYKLYKGQEKEHFVYCDWLGEIKEQE
jgi:hypothetical protein